MTRTQYVNMLTAEIDTVFFAKTEQQYKKAIKAPQFAGRMIIKAGSSLYGTAEGLAEYFDIIEHFEQTIKQN